MQDRLANWGAFNKFCLENFPTRFAKPALDFGQMKGGDKIYYDCFTILFYDSFSYIELKMSEKCTHYNKVINFPTTIFAIGSLLQFMTSCILHTFDFIEVTDIYVNPSITFLTEYISDLFCWGNRHAFFVNAGTEIILHYTKHFSTDMHGRTFDYLYVCMRIARSTPVICTFQQKCNCIIEMQFFANIFQLCMHFYGKYIYTHIYMTMKKAC